MPAYSCASLDRIGGHEPARRSFPLISLILLLPKDISSFCVRRVRHRSPSATPSCHRYSCKPHGWRWTFNTQDLISISARRLAGELHEGAGLQVSDSETHIIHASGVCRCTDPMYYQRENTRSVITLNHLAALSRWICSPKPILFSGSYQIPEYRISRVRSSFSILAINHTQLTFS